MLRRFWGEGPDRELLRGELIESGEGIAALQNASAHNRLHQALLPAPAQPNDDPQSA